MASSPLWQYQPEEIAVTWRGQALRASQVWFHVNWLSQQLPKQTDLINLCEDRYLFLISWLAAIVNGSHSLFPPSNTVADITSIAQQNPNAVLISDRDTSEYGVTAFSLPPTLPEGECDVPNLHIDDDRVVATLYTSGSTGAPQPCEKRWGELFDGATATGTRLHLAEHAGAPIVATTPSQHMFGLETAILLPLRWRLVMVAERPFFPNDLLHVLQRQSQPAIVVTTPLHLRACVRTAMSWPATAMILSATAPLNRQLAGDAEAVFHTSVMEIYGSTETGAIATRQTACEDMWTMLGTLQIRIDKDGSTVEGGHLNSPVALNDVVKLNDDGRFLLLGRDKDLVKVAGKRISLQALNQFLLTIDGVEDGTFIVPDSNIQHDNQRLAALVVAPEVNKETIFRQLRKSIDAVFLPRPLIHCDALPRNATGKLRHLETQRLFERLRHGSATQ